MTVDKNINSKWVNRKCDPTAVGVCIVRHLNSTSHEMKWPTPFIDFFFQEKCLWPQSIRGSHKNNVWLWISNNYLPLALSVNFVKLLFVHFLMLSFHLQLCPSLIFWCYLSTYNSASLSFLCYLCTYNSACVLFFPIVWFLKVW